VVGNRDVSGWPGCCYQENQDAADTERANGITDLVEAGSIVAIAAADDACYDCYLLKDFSPSELRLSSNTVDDYGAAYQKGPFFLEGNFFLGDNIIDTTYKLNKQALNYTNTVLAICGELTAIRRYRKEFFNSRLLNMRQFCLYFSSFAFLYSINAFTSVLL